MNVCENCGWTITDGTKHESQGEDLCIVREIDTEKTLGWKRRKGQRDLYRKH
jgi:hypothetical protein